MDAPVAAPFNHGGIEIRLIPTQNARLVALVITAAGRPYGSDLGYLAALGVADSPHPPSAARAAGGMRPASRARRH